MIKIDGSYGEGGGQILRTALGLAALYQKAVHIFNIRANRPKPGLRPQHLACVKAMQVITKAKVKGAEVGASELFFAPQGNFAGDYHFDIGTAGATSLVLQCLLLPLSQAKEPSTLIIKGGTHVPFSPPFHYLQYVFVPMLAKLGIKVEIELRKWGWYPEGGGEIYIKVYPASFLKAQRWEDFPSFSSLKGLSVAANLPKHVIKRQAKRLKNQIEKLGFSLKIEENFVSSRGKGSFLFLWVDEEIKAGFAAVGIKGKPAEKVADEVSDGFLKYFQNKVALDAHLADQIIPYLALAPGTSSFTTIISSHLRTNIWVIRQFLKRTIDLKGTVNAAGRVMIK